MRVANLPDGLSKPFRYLTTGFVALRRTGAARQSTRPTLANREGTHQPLRPFLACSVWLSSARSATSFFNRRFCPRAYEAASRPRLPSRLTSCATRRSSSTTCRATGTDPPVARPLHCPLLLAVRFQCQVARLSRLRSNRDLPASRAPLSSLEVAPFHIAIAA